MESVKPRLDKNGQIKKRDFIEYSIETKLLDLTDSSKKTVEGTPKRNTKNDWSRKTDTRRQVRILAEIGILRFSPFRLSALGYSAASPDRRRRQRQHCRRTWTGWRMLSRDLTLMLMAL